MKKKDLIFISIIIILLISLIITIIYFKKNNNTMISGEVLAVGSNYLLIGTSDNEDYVINTNTKDYQIGDELKLSINNIKKNRHHMKQLLKILQLLENHLMKNMNKTILLIITIKITVLKIIRLKII